MVRAIACTAFGLAAPALAETASAPFGAAASIGVDQLAQIVGRADISQQVNATNTGTVAHNTVSGNSVTGTINFDSQSFQNMNGLSLLSANTGNNVSINASLNVNVTLQR